METVIKCCCGLKMTFLHSYRGMRMAIECWDLSLTLARVDTTDWTWTRCLGCFRGTKLRSLGWAARRRGERRRRGSRLDWCMTITYIIHDIMFLALTVNPHRP